VSILPKTVAEALLLIDKAEESSADLVEIRLDNLKNLGRLSDLASHGETPKIATDKNSSRNEKERLQSLLKAAKSGFDYVDVDLSIQNLKSTVSDLKSSGTKCILSFHDYNSSLSLLDLNSVLEKGIFLGADVCKIVTTPKHIEDNLTLLQFTSAVSEKNKIVCFGMGELGKISRLLSPVYGGFFTFASLEHGSETAPGQMTVQEMRAAYELLGIKLK
jgi:3-dehydroquinate dehydratase/shikimate dehydrogenase